MRKNLYVIILISLGLINLGFLALVAKLFITHEKYSSPYQLIQVNNKNVSDSVSTNTTSITIRAVGDVMLGRAVNLQSQKHHDFTWPFQKSLPFLDRVDFLMGNLENPLIANCPAASEGMIFCAPNEAVVGLTYAGFNFLSLANNHILNYGHLGAEETESILDQNSISHLRHGGKMTQLINGIPITIIAFDDLTYPLKKLQIPDLKDAPVAIAYLHWGEEYQPKSSLRQQNVVGWLMDQGIDIVIGSHPHVMQSIQQPQSTQLVAYSLGNFVFDQMWSHETRTGLILDLHLSFQNKTLTNIDYQTHKIKIYDYGQPQLQ